MNDQIRALQKDVIDAKQRLREAIASFETDPDRLRQAKLTNADLLAEAFLRYDEGALVEASRLSRSLG